jgi:hypothetical protein
MLAKYLRKIVNSSVVLPKSRDGGQGGLLSRQKSKLNTMRARHTACRRIEKRKRWERLVLAARAFLVLVIVAPFYISLSRHSVSEQYHRRDIVEHESALFDRAQFVAARAIAMDEDVATTDAHIEYEKDAHEDEDTQVLSDSSDSLDEPEEEEDPTRRRRPLLPPRMRFNSPALKILASEGAFDPQCSSWQPGNRSRPILATFPQQMLVDEHYDFVPGSTEPNNPQSYFFCRAAKRLGWTRPAELKRTRYNLLLKKSDAERRWLRDLARNKVTLVCHGSGDLNIHNMKRAKESWEESHIALLERWEDSYMSSMTKVSASKQASKRVLVVLVPWSHV